MSNATPAVAPFTIPGVLACVPGELHASLEAVDGPGGWNSMAWTFDVRDIGSLPCFVGPTPDVSFSSASGPIALSKDMDWPGNIVYLAPALDPAPGPQR